MEFAGLQELKFKYWAVKISYSTRKYKNFQKNHLYQVHLRHQKKSQFKIFLIFYKIYWMEGKTGLTLDRILAKLQFSVIVKIL